jgi:hypothetical protein
MVRTFQKNVTTSGTPVQLPSATVRSGRREAGDLTLLLKAKSTNTGTISWGFSSDEALKTSTDHFKLAANEAIEIDVNNANEIWIDSTVNGEGVEGFIG